MHSSQFKGTSHFQGDITVLSWYRPLIFGAGQKNPYVTYLIVPVGSYGYQVTVLMPGYRLRLILESDFWWPAWRVMLKWQVTWCSLTCQLWIVFYSCQLISVIFWFVSIAALALVVEVVIIMSQISHNHAVIIPVCVDLRISVMVYYSGGYSVYLLGESYKYRGIKMLVASSTINIQTSWLLQTIYWLHIWVRGKYLPSILCKFENIHEIRVV
jgi:hypothetical protein